MYRENIESFAILFIRGMIDLVLNGIRNYDEMSMDIYLDELYGSINSAYWDGIISQQHADHLRKKYLVDAF